MITHGYVSIEGAKIFALPENYSTFSTGSSSNLIATLGNEIIIDTGYGSSGFSISGQAAIGNYSAIGGLDNIAKMALQNGSPINVSDTLYPGGKSWIGYIQRPVKVSGMARLNSNIGIAYYGSNDIMMANISLTFYSAELEAM